MTTLSNAQQTREPALTELHKEVRRMFRPRVAARRELATLALAGTAYACAWAGLVLEPALAVRCLLLGALAYLSVQAGLIAHELSHHPVTRNRHLDYWLGRVYLTVFTGISYARFCELHRGHHALGATQSLMPRHKNSAVAKASGAARREAWMARALVFLIAFVQRAAAIGWVAKRRKSTRPDQFALVLHYGFWLGLPAWLIGPQAALVNYLAVSLLIGPYASMLYFITHEGMAVTNPKSPPPYAWRQLASTRDLGQGWIHDLVFGGVNNHVAHHLFPEVPRQELARLRPAIRACCARHELPYTETSSGAALRGLLREICAGGRAARS